MFTDEQIERYSRHIILKEVGGKGQQRLLNGKVLIIGAGALGVLPGVIGTIQATESIKYLLGVGKLLAGRLLVYDAEDMDFYISPISRQKRCPLCGENPVITELRDEVDAMNVCDLDEAGGVKGV
ncbi:MAG: hypothetical protein VB050_10430 [Geobacteraceae bacterium]|nr:hypothetical protein [Geobacteraceae bacterium]